MKRLILASSSPRRAQLLTHAGLSFTTIRPDIDETPFPNEPPTDYVQRLSREKAQTAFAILADRTSVILSADTTVVDGNDILGKPIEAADAAAMLSRLSGRDHTVHTGFSIFDAATGTMDTHLATSIVRMRNMTDDEIAAYVESGDPFGKAGSYAIQNQTFRPVQAFNGCYTNIVGLPLCMVIRALREFGISAELPSCTPDITNSCQFYGMSL